MNGKNHDGNTRDFLTASSPNSPTMTTENISFQEAMIQCTEAVLKENEINYALCRLVEICCGFYRGSQCFLVEYQEETDDFHRSFEIFPKNPPEDFPTEFSKEFFQPCDDAFYGEREVHIALEELAENSLLRDFMVKNQLNSCLFAPIKEDEELIAVLVIDNPQITPMDLRLVHSMMIFFQQGLQKRDMMQKLESVYDTDQTTGFYTYQKYLSKLEEFLENTPKVLGIVLVDLTSNEELYDQYNEDDIKQAASVMESFFKEPFYRVEEKQFVCFLADIPKEDLVNQVDSLRIETEVNRKALFYVAYSWESGEENVQGLISDVLNLMVYESEAGLVTSGSHLSEVSVQKDLLNAIKRKEFEIYFQPKVHLETRQVVGAEALVRRKTSFEDALLYPAIFVKLYEDQAIIRHLDLYVVDFVCKTLAKWMDEGLAIPTSVNFSRVTLTEYGIVQTICDICEKHGVPHHLLIIEFTERIAMMNDKAYQQLAEDFENHGFLLSLDDFGAAYSNLITLAKIEIDEIKIDKTLIKDMEIDDKNKIILKSIIDMCNSIDNMTPLAEGVETEYQAQKLMEYGCPYGQGNLFSPPVSVDDFFENFLKD